MSLYIQHRIAGTGHARDKNKYSPQRHGEHGEKLNAYGLCVLHASVVKGSFFTGIAGMACSLPSLDLPPNLWERLQPRMACKKSSRLKPLSQSLPVQND
ncbi:MAG: hypothetical protein L3K24_08140 [Gammaproteobacteria bacterium]|nr:hypothetical protein [Gammaproteobacteria bacterium]